MGRGQKRRGERMKDIRRERKDEEGDTWMRSGRKRAKDDRDGRRDKGAVREGWRQEGWREAAGRGRECQKRSE